MIQWTEELNKQLTTVKFFGIVILVIAPILYLVVAYFLEIPTFKEGGQFEIMFYILLIVSMIQPTIIPLVEKFQISVFKKNPNSNFVNINQEGLPFLTKPKKGSAMGLYTIIIIIKCVIVEAIYVYGMVNLFMTGDVTKMLYFYPIGIAWSLVYFPTKSRCEKFLEKVSSNATV